MSKAFRLLFLTGCIDFQLVDHHLDVVVLISVGLQTTGEFLYLAIDTNVEVAFLAHALKKLTIVAFPLSHQGRKNVNRLSVVVAENHRDDFLLGILDHFLATLVAVGCAGTSVE